MLKFQGKHRTRRYFLKHVVLTKLVALGEYFVGPLPA